MRRILFREASLMSSMAELVHDIIPQTTNLQTVPERIEWVNIQKCSNGLLFVYCTR